MSIFFSIICYTLLYTSILVIVGYGGMFAERSGVINLGLEGCMVIGGFVSALLMRYLPSWFPPSLGCIIIIIVSCLSGMLYSMILAIPAIKFKANQTLVGTALNLVAPALAVVIIKLITSKETGTSGFSYLDYSQYSSYFKIPITIFGCEGVYFNWLILIVLVLIPIVCIVLYKTSYGLRLKACGENPSAADSLGINVNKTRYIGVGLSGLLAGFGGLLLILTGQEWDFSNGAIGFGFLALAVMIFGQWKPLLIFAGSLLFGSLKTISICYPSIDILARLNISTFVYLALPYVVCLIVLIFTSKKSKAPKAVGVPYDKSIR